MTALEPCPNPECGGGDASVVEWFGDGWKTEVAYVRCGDCGMHGPHVDVAAPVSQADIDAAIDEARRLWNALPRRLKSTTGFPATPGWYWQYVPGHGWMIDYLDETDCREPLRLDHCTHIAGPIPQPAERSDRDA